MGRSRGASKTFEALRQAALAHPAVEESLACRGTAVESASFEVGGKAFLFLDEAKAMVKLGASREQAGELAAQGPGTCKTGAGGWTTVVLSEPAGVPLATLRAWIAESYAHFAQGPASKPVRRKR